MPLPVNIQQPPAAVRVNREFTAGAPGILPVSSSVIATLPTLGLARTQQVVGFYTASTVINVAGIAAGGVHNYSNTYVFSDTTNLATPGSFPSAFTLATGQSLGIFVSYFLTTVPTANLVISTPIIMANNQSGSQAWSYNGPLTVNYLGATVQMNFYAPGATAPQTLTFVIEAIAISSQATKSAT